MMSFAAPSKHHTTPILPLAGMVDVMFLLLIFFMTVSAFREYDQQIDVSPPATESGAAATSPTHITVTVTEDGEIFLGEKRYEHEQLQQTLTELAAAFPEEAVVIRGDKAARLDAAVAVMDIAYKANLKNVYLATVEAAKEQ